MTEQLGTSGNLREPTAAGSRIFYVICPAAFLEVPGRSIIDGPNGRHHASIVHAFNSASSNLKSEVTLKVIHPKYYKHLKKGAHQSHLGRQKMGWFLVD